MPEERSRVRAPEAAESRTERRRMMTLPWFLGGGQNGRRSSPSAVPTGLLLLCRDLHFRPGCPQAPGVLGDDFVDLPLLDRQSKHRELYVCFADRAVDRGGIGDFFGLPQHYG